MMRENETDQIENAATRYIGTFDAPTWAFREVVGCGRYFSWWNDKRAQVVRRGRLQFCRTYRCAICGPKILATHFAEISRLGCSATMLHVLHSRHALEANLRRRTIRRLSSEAGYVYVRRRGRGIFIATENPSFTSQRTSTAWPGAEDVTSINTEAPQDIFALASWSLRQPGLMKVYPKRGPRRQRDEGEQQDETERENERERLTDCAPEEFAEFASEQGFEYDPQFGSYSYKTNPDEVAFELVEFLDAIRDEKTLNGIVVYT